MNKRITKLAVLAAAIGSLARSAWPSSVESAPKLGAVTLPSISAPALPSVSRLSLGASFISVPGAPAAALEAASVQAPIPAVAAALPKGELRQTVAAFSSAVSDPRHAGATIARAFDAGSRVAGADEDGGDEASQAEAYLQDAVDQINQQVSRLRVGRFGIQLRASLQGEHLAVRALFTLDGRTITPEALNSALRSGEVDPAEWKRAQAKLTPVAQKLAQSLLAGMQGSGDESSARALSAQAHSMPGAAFRTVVGPGSEAPETPPHLTSTQFDRLLSKLAAVDRSKSAGRPSLKEADVERLAHVLTTIDRLNVDPIPASAWDRTFKAMGHAAKHAFHPQKYDWSKTTTLLIKLAVRRLLDLHSAYFDTKENKAFEEHTQHQFAGIGLQYVVTEAGLVSFVAPDGAAQKAGLKPGDKIVSIDGVLTARIPGFNAALSGKNELKVLVEREEGGQKAQVQIDLPAGAGQGVRVVEESEFGRITHVMPEGPAAKAGVKEGDRVVSMNGIKLSKEDPTSLLKKSHGEAGTQVKLVVERGGRVLPEIAITRAEMDVPNVFSKMVAPGVGYVQLGIFSSDAGKTVFNAIKSLREQGARKLVLDLRANPGGDVNAVSSILASFAKSGTPLISFKRQGQLMFGNIAEGDGAYSDMPVVALVNGYSASGSEATSGALQDMRGKVVIGTRTYGKGTMQTTEPDEQGRGLHLTQARWYTPADRNIDAKRDPSNQKRWINQKGTGGVVPDYEVPLSKEHDAYLLGQLQAQLHGQKLDRPVVADPQLEKALEVLANLK